MSYTHIKALPSPQETPVLCSNPRLMHHLMERLKTKVLLLWVKFKAKKDADPHREPAFPVQQLSEPGCALRVRKV